jgi:hypothetical protein
MAHDVLNILDEVLLNLSALSDGSDISAITQSLNCLETIVISIDNDHIPLSTIIEAR